MTVVDVEELPVDSALESAACRCTASTPGAADGPLDAPKPRGTTEPSSSVTKPVGAVAGRGSESTLAAAENDICAGTDPADDADGLSDDRWVAATPTGRRSPPAPAAATCLPTVTACAAPIVLGIDEAVGLWASRAPLGDRHVRGWDANGSGERAIGEQPSDSDERTGIGGARRSGRARGRFTP